MVNDGGTLSDRRQLPTVCCDYRVDGREVLEFLINVASGTFVLKPNYLENFGCAATIRL